MPRPFRFCVLAAAAAAVLAACTDDPFERPGTMAPRGFNDANLCAMIVDPAHLRRGVDADTTGGDAGAKPVDLLRAGKRAPLFALPASSVGGGGSNGSQ